MRAGERVQAREGRLVELDLLRAVALLGVGVVHASAWLAPAEAPPWQGVVPAVSSLARFCVPAFVFASGFALSYAYRTRPIQAGSFLRRRWLRVLVPWACCVPLFLALDAFTGEVRLQPGAVGVWLAYGPGHLYFLLLIAQLYLLFLVLPREPRRLAWACTALAAVQLALMAWRSYGPLPGGALAWPGVYLSHEEAPFWMATFALGCLTAAEWPRLATLDRVWPLAVLASLGTGALLLAEGHAISASSLHQGNAAYLWPSRLLQTATWSVTVLWLGHRWSRMVRHMPAASASLARLRFGWRSAAPNSRMALLWPRPAGQPAEAVGLGLSVDQPMRTGRRWFSAEPLVNGLSRHSLGIYLLHPIALTLLGPRTAALPPALRIPALLIASFAAAWLALHALALTRPTAAAVGEEPPRLRPDQRLPAAA